jgi:hypothetical protein
MYGNYFLCFLALKSQHLDHGWLFSWSWGLNLTKNEDSCPKKVQKKHFLGMVQAMQSWLLAISEEKGIGLYINAIFQTQVSCMCWTPQNAHSVVDLVPAAVRGPDLVRLANPPQAIAALVLTSRPTIGSHSLTLHSHFHFGLRIEFWGPKLAKIGLLLPFGHHTAVGMHLPSCSQ